MLKIDIQSRLQPRIGRSAFGSRTSTWLSDRAVFAHAYRARVHSVLSCLCILRATPANDQPMRILVRRDALTASPRTPYRVCVRLKESREAHPRERRIDRAAPGIRKKCDHERDTLPAARRHPSANGSVPSIRSKAPWPRRRRRGTPDCHPARPTARVAHRPPRRCGFERSMSLIRRSRTRHAAWILRPKITRSRDRRPS